MPTKKTLLQKARQLPVTAAKSDSVGKQEIALALAWARGEITLRQVSHALGLQSSGSPSYVMLARALRAYIREKENR